jgi:hypothetical protein
MHGRFVYPVHDSESSEESTKTQVKGATRHDLELILAALTWN